MIDPNGDRLASGLLFVTLAASFYNVGTIWMVQVAYELWAKVGPAEFPAYHRTWWHTIQPVIFPVAAVAFLGFLAMLRWTPDGIPQWELWLGVALQLLVYGLTAVWWAPWQARLQNALLPNGTLDPMYRKLLRSHWFRVALLTASGLLAFAMVVQRM
jgi:hypothetical protein